jgi:membrane protease YdiL (CAAX protease family)
MSAQSVWAGLADSAFLADLDDRERTPRVVLITLIGGVGLYFLVGVCVWCLLMAPITLFGAHASEGWSGMRLAWLDLVQPSGSVAPAIILPLLVTTAVDAVPLLACVALAAVIAHKPMHDYATAAPRFRWPLLGLGLALSMLVLTPALAAERVLGTDGPPPILAISGGWPAKGLYLAAGLTMIPAALAEELLFRGWLLRLTAGFAKRSGPLLVVTSIVFAAAHFAFVPAMDDADAFIRLALMGGGWAYMTLRLGGVEFAAGSHAANNLLIVLFLHPLKAETPSANGGPLELLTDLTLVLGYFVITEAVVRWPLLRRIGLVRATEISPPDNVLPEPG